jgi:ATP-dependent Clp protease ATP-binding subunit ClpC
MMNFDLKTTKIFQAVKWERHPAFRFAKPLKKLFLILFIFTFLIFLYGFLSQTFSERASQIFLGLSIIFLVLAIGKWLRINFLDSKLKKPSLKIKLEKALADPEKYNLAEFLSFEVAKAVFRARGNSTWFFYNLLTENPKLNFIFSRALLSLKEIKKILREYLLKISLQTEVEPQPEFQAAILESLKIAQKKGHQRVEVGDMICALAKHDLIFKKILIDANLKVEDIENLTWWLEDLEKNIEERKKFWEWKNLIKIGTLAKEWTAGYTINLDRFSIDWSEIVKKQHFPETIGHQKEIAEMERILSRRESKNNVLIVGEPGSGRKSMIQALAVKSVLGESLPEINFKKVKQLDLPSLLAQTETTEEAESILDTIFKEVVTAGNVILVIDEFHNYVLPAPRPGTIDISGVISPYLALISFQIVAITTFEGLHKNIEQNPSILPLFEKVEVSEISERETLMLLENLALLLEYKYKKFISYPALRDIINYCGKYLPATPFPEKAIDLLDEVMVYLAQTKEKILLPKHVAKIVAEKTQIPVGEIEIKEREILLNLENLIHQRIINQEEAVKEVSAALRRARAEVTAGKGPMGTFLFLGPTGVGKTETSKALAEIYFGSEERMIRLDMSEFQNVEDIPRLIGSPGEEGLLTTQVRERPFSLILLDEIEKSHPNILNLFLQVFDEGHLTDGLGRKVDFKNSIIIATSNAGYQVILEALKQKTEWSLVKEKLLDYLFEKGIFRPEFINRFDAVVVYKPLSKENLLAISELLLQKIKNNLAQKDIEFIITEPLKEKIVELSYDITFGARNMERVIQDKVGNPLASAILSGQLIRGNRVEIDPAEFKLKINP